MASIIMNMECCSEHEWNDTIASASAAGFETCRNSTCLDVFSTNPEQHAALHSWNKKKDMFLVHKKSSHICNATSLSITPHAFNYGNSFNMKQLAAIYSIPVPSFKKSLVAVVSFGGGLYGNVSSSGIVTDGDVQKYWTSLGIDIKDQPTVIIKLLQGAKNTPRLNDGGATMENTLDIETIGGACPSSNLTIVLYIAPDSATFASVFTYIYNTKINGMSPNVVSCSWGQSEIYVPKSDLTATNAILETMTSKGINICVASGDYGSNNGVGGSGKYVDFPSSSPYVTAVGGTTLICPNYRYDSRTVEKAWSSGGGGISTKFPKPSYQSKISGNGRSTPDIASCADPDTGVIYLIGGSYQIIGGTSISAPTFAAYLLAIGANTFVNPVLYSGISSCYNDILSGDNGGYKAKLGYDNCTGWGSINGAVLQKSLIVSKGIIKNPAPRTDFKPKLSTDVYNFKQLASIYNFPAPSDQPYVVAVPAFYDDSTKGYILRGTATPDSTDSSLYTITNGDVQQSWASMGIAPENYPLVLIKVMPGAIINPNYGDGEATLDVTTLGAACPSSNLTIIVYVTANLTEYYPLFNYIYTTPIVRNGVTYKNNVISMSLGNAEVDVPDDDKDATNNLFKTMTEKGINILVASGDWGSSYKLEGLNVDFPSSSPYTVSVGGTTLNCPNLVYDDATVEIVWNNDPVTDATGGGESDYFAKLSYQNIPALSSYTNRCIPDIALDADPETLAPFYLNGVLTVLGGTSMSAPLFAAFLACINCKKWVTPLLYTAPSNCFHDITEGTNGVDPKYYSAKVGFDLCTGWGSINGLYLKKVLSDTVLCTGVTVVPTPVTMQVSQTVQLVATVTPANATDKTVSYTSSNPLIATVSNSGLVTGVGVGSTTVVVRTTDGSNKSFTVPVSVTSSVILCTGLTVDPEYQTVETTQTKQLYPFVTPANATNKTLTYTSSNSLIATVSNTGLVSGIARGFADIVVRTEDGSNLSFTVKFTITQSDVPCTGVTVIPTFVIVQKTKTAQLVATVTPANATDKTVSYTSSNPLIATVSNTGLVTGVAVGSTSVVVKTEDGSNKSFTVPVTVISEPICVAKDTMITMVDGSSKPIQNIHRGDRVLCDKETEHIRRVCRVTEIMHDGNAIQIPKGLLGNTKDVVFTPEHPVWIGNNSRQYSKDINGAVRIKISEKVYNIQFEEEGTFYAGGIKVDSMSPNFYEMKLPKELYFNRLKHNKRLFVSGEDDPIRGKPPMI